MPQRLCLVGRSFLTLSSSSPSPAVPGRRDARVAAITKPSDFSAARKPLVDAVMKLYQAQHIKALSLVRLKVRPQEKAHMYVLRDMTPEAVKRARDLKFAYETDIIACRKKIRELKDFNDSRGMYMVESQADGEQLKALAEDTKAFTKEVEECPHAVLVGVHQSSYMPSNMLTDPQIEQATHYLNCKMEWVRYALDRHRKVSKQQKEEDLRGHLAGPSSAS